MRLLYDDPEARHRRLPDQLRPPEGRRRRPGRAGRAGRHGTELRGGGPCAAWSQGAPSSAVRERAALRGSALPRTPPRIGRCSFSQRTSRPSYRSVTSGPTGARPVPDVSIADMAVGRTGADDGSTPARRCGCGRTGGHRAGHPRSDHGGGGLRPAGAGTRRPRRPAGTGELPGRGGPRRGRPGCSTAWPPGTRTRASRCTCRRCRRPELGPGEALVAVMASAINYNTVWTSIFEPLPTFKFLQRYGRLSELTRRHDLPYHVVGSDAAGVVLRTGPGRDPVEGRRRGGRALPLGRAGGRGRPRRHHARPAAADLGLRDQLRRPGRAGRGQGQPADAQAAPPELGGGGQPRAGQLHRVPAARLAPRRAT